MDRSPDQPITAAARVLVVDDHPSNLLAVEAILEPLGHPLTMASSGDEALRHLLHDDFALILLDVQMVGMDGLETAALIKGLDRTRHIPIMFLTAAHPEVERVFEASQHGAVDYVRKPIEPELLRAKAKVFIDLYLQGEQIKRQATQLVENARMYEQERQARAAAEAATRAREDALAVVAHDLRNPLATISMGAAAMLASMPAGDDYAPLRRTAATIHRVADQMAGLLSDLLDVSRMESGHLVLARLATPAAALIDQAIEIVSPLAAKREQRLIVDSAVADDVLCDPIRLPQVFSNLLGNAIKFTPPGGTIVLRARRIGERVEFAVIDDGPGIPPEQLPHVFERYWKARTADRDGVGLGLAIAQGIVEAHDGRIEVESSGSGTTFKFTVPVV